MARPQKVVKSNTRRSIAAKYRKGAGLVALAEEFELSTPVIRRVLCGEAVTIRGRGRPTLQT